MCAKKEPDEIYRPVAKLVEEMPESIRTLVMDGTDRLTSGCWIGGYAFYALLEGI